MFLDLLADAVGFAITPSAFLVLGVWMLRTGRRALGRPAAWDLRLVALIAFVSLVLLGIFVGRVAVGLGTWTAIVCFVVGFVQRIVASVRARHVTPGRFEPSEDSQHSNSS